MFGLLGTFFWRASTSVSIHPFFTDMSRLHFQDEHVQEMGLMLQECLPSAILCVLPLSSHGCSLCVYHTAQLIENTQEMCADV